MKSATRYELVNASLYLLHLLVAAAAPPKTRIRFLPSRLKRKENATLGSSSERMDEWTRVPAGGRADAGRSDRAAEAREHQSLIR